MSVNKVILLGRLGKDPETRVTPSGTSITNFTMATSERRKDASGNSKELTEWHNVIAFGKTGELVQKYLKKGQQLFLEGRIQTRKWQDKEGKDRYTTEIVTSNITFVGGGAPRSGEGNFAQSSSSMANSDDTAPMMAAAANAPTEVAFDDDDIPF